MTAVAAERITNACGYGSRVEPGTTAEDLAGDSRPSTKRP
ncbi:hypothetical protein ACVJGD_005149 [Bradyrhizobium sp. USDA 10063]